MMIRTPQTYREALQRTENWAMATSERYTAMSNASLDHRSHGDFSNDIDSDDGDEDAAGNSATKDSTLLSTATGILDRLWHLRQSSESSSSLTHDNQHHLHHEHEIQYIQDRKLSGTTISLWSNVSEVIFYDLRNYIVITGIK
jgi:hypothetical protein